MARNVLLPLVQCLGPSLAKRGFGGLSVFERTRSLGKRGPVKHGNASKVEDVQTLEEDNFPGKGDRRSDTGHWANMASHWRGVNTDALPMAKFEREQAAAASKAPEHKVKMKGAFRDLADADQKLEMPKKQRRIRARKAVVIQPAARQPQVAQQPKEPRENLLKHFKKPQGSSSP
ncbi:unnamed protein product [Cladocopium goreaui]|uniref:Aspartic proteinase nepenthesin-1 n=1 Tax=Cladocopium goreaui TaxID=2562237 RepID=A0A9P1BY86_9DINO|nr:unnamed protein product [Cladocopium goreaui]|mmetsp:Transcript_76427/g.168853  ORF Transcript_76427/g.168853 Transcript_76427/m.168853 type:complete len:175 (+) Transcript_76427:68-592(+)